MKAGLVDSDLIVDEGVKKCEPNENICYGKLTVTTVNLTTFGNESAIVRSICCFV